MNSCNGYYGKARKALLLTFLALILTAPQVSLVGAWNHVNTKVSVDYHGSPLILDPSLVPGTIFTVDIAVNYIEKLWGYQLKLGESNPEIWGSDPAKYQGWNASILHLLSVENGPFLGSEGGTVQFFPGNINDTQGTLSLTIGALDPAKQMPTGGGTLITLTYEVLAVGGSPIQFSLDSGLLNKTGVPNFNGVWLRGTPPPPRDPPFEHPDFLVDSYFDNRPMRADLVGRSAWPGRHHFSMSKHGPNQALHGKVKNRETTADGFATIEVYVKVIFNITKPDGSSILNETTPVLLAPGQMEPGLTFEFDPSTYGGTGKYSVIAKCWYKPSDGIRWLPGEKTKKFTFSVVP